MTAAVHGYVDAFARGDVDAVVALFAPDASVEDPIGSPPRIGHAAIRAFYRDSMATGARLELAGPIRIAAAHAAFAMQVRLHFNGQDLAIDVIDTFAFDPAGRITAMHAYFGPTNMHPNPPEES
jgi:steroid delta-isomerase